MAAKSSIDPTAVTFADVVGAIYPPSDYRIYVACLAAYNAGTLHGEWIDIDDDLPDAIEAMLARSPIDGAEEWAAHDYDLPFRLDTEHPDLAELIARVATLESLDSDDEREAMSEYADNLGEWPTEEAFRAAYCGKWRTQGEYAEQLVEDLGILDGAGDTLASYFDYDAYARDLFLGDMLALDASGGGVHVFNCRG